MNRKSVAVFFIAVLALAGLGYGGWRYNVERQQHSCRACSRPVHDHSRTIAIVDGKRGFYCCPACALSEHRQAGKPVRVTELADYQGGGVLNPAEAVVVRNSDVNPCKSHEAAMTPDKQPLQTDFDRCSPSILAFRNLKAAQSFAAEHGGQILRFAALAAEFNR